MRAVLAVDRGGSKAEAFLVRDDGVALGHGRCQIPGLSGRSDQACFKAVEQAVADNLGSISELHLAGAGPSLPLGLFPSGDSPWIRLHRVMEHEAALAPFGLQHGVVVLSGTGAFVHVEAPNGLRAHLDGSGPLLGDGGSGYQIGLLAIRAAMRASWHPRRKTALEERVFSAFGARHAHEMIPLNFKPMESCVVAALAQTVDESARAGDSVARAILNKAADSLAETLRDALDGLGLAQSDMALIGTGSVIKNSDLYWDRLLEKTRSFAPALRPSRESMPSAAGIALAVLQGFPGLEMESIRKNLMTSIKNHSTQPRNQSLRAP